MFRHIAAAGLALAVGACGTVLETPRPSRTPMPAVAAASTPGGRNLAAAVEDYRRAEQRVEVQAVALCREAYPQRPRRSCAFEFVLVDDPRIGPNAFQTTARDGRPVVAMTVQLVAETRNQDEIAFILGHEAAHHIADHIARSQSQAITGALVLGTLATLGNASEDEVRDMMDLGASIGGRAYSQTYELEADQLGAYIAARAGYDPERGARVFTQPALSSGGGLLSTHPASAQRQAAVSATAAEIRRQQAAGRAPDPTPILRAVTN